MDIVCLVCLSLLLLFVCLMVGEIVWMLFVRVNRFFLVVVVVLVEGAGDFDVDADRFVGRFVIVRLGETGRGSSSLTAADVSTVIDGVDEIIERPVEFELLLIVRNDDDDVGVVVMVDGTGLLMIRRGVGVDVGCWEMNIGDVELPDDERMSEMEFERSVVCCVASGKN